MSMREGKNARLWVSDGTFLADLQNSIAAPIQGTIRCNVDRRRIKGQTALTADGNGIAMVQFGVLLRKTTESEKLIGCPPDVVAKIGFTDTGRTGALIAPMTCVAAPITSPKGAVVITARFTSQFVPGVSPVWADAASALTTAQATSILSGTQYSTGNVTALIAEGERL